MYDLPTNDGGDSGDGDHEDEPVEEEWDREGGRAWIQGVEKLCTLQYFWMICMQPVNAWR
jgi:hypothetical protein